MFLYVLYVAQTAVGSVRIIQYSNTSYKYLNITNISGILKYSNIQIQKKLFSGPVLWQIVWDKLEEIYFGRWTLKGCCTPLSHLLVKTQEIRF